MNTLTSSIHIESDFKALIKAIERELEKPGEVPVQCFVNSQSFLNDQLATFVQQIGLVSPRQDFSQLQFKAYCEIWKTLQALRLAGDDLWKSASKNHLVEFANQLRNTTKEAHEASIFFEELDYQQLLSALKAFGNFQIGKERLIDIRSVQEIEYWKPQFSNEMITKQIRRNENCKVQYEKILDTIRISFKQKLSDAA
jgi:hypothetical protein